LDYIQLRTDYTVFQLGTVEAGPFSTQVSTQNSIRSIFNPLVRGADALPSSRARLPGSIGLGLYIVREVAAAHGGTVHVSSTDAGTVFTVRLPRTAHRA
jgi:signal transduction histidine kinase